MGVIVCFSSLSFYHGLDMFLATRDALVINGSYPGFFTSSNVLFKCCVFMYMDPMGLGGSLACQAPAFSQAMVAELKLISLQSPKFALLEFPMSKKFERRHQYVMVSKYGSS